MSVLEKPTRMQRLAGAVAKRIAGKMWPKAINTTTAGVGDVDNWSWMRAFMRVDTERVDVYTDLETMDDTVDEVATSLDILSDNAVNAETGTHKSFHIVYPDESKASPVVQQAIESMITRTRLEEKIYGITRDLLKYGDNFQQVVVDKNFSIVRLMYMPPKSMNRNEDDQGALPSELGAFTQTRPRTQQVIASFYPWQIIHMRWNRSGGQLYGRSIGKTARTSWRKMQAMEEALVINWLTRAFARLLFTIDVTGKTPTQAKLAVAAFRRDLEKRKIAEGVEGIEQLSVVKDIFLGQGFHTIAGKAVQGLTNVQVLDTSSSGFSNLGPVEYYRNKVVMSLRVPPAYLGLEENINAKATLVQQDRRFARTIRRIQTTISLELIVPAIDLQLLLMGLDPTAISYLVTWPAVAISDVVQGSMALRNTAMADKIYKEMGIYDDEYIAVNHLHMTPMQFKEVSRRIRAEVQNDAVPKGQDTTETEE